MRPRQRARRRRGSPASCISATAGPAPGPSDNQAREQPVEGQHRQRQRLQEVELREPALLHGRGLGGQRRTERARHDAGEARPFARIADAAALDLDPRSSSAAAAASPAARSGRPRETPASDIQRGTLTMRASACPSQRR